MGSNTRFASHRATTRPRYRRIGGAFSYLGPLFKIPWGLADVR